MGKAFGAANRRISEKAVEKSKPRVKGLSSPGGTIAMPGIRPSSKQRAAVIRLLGSNPTLFANVFGTLSHQGGQPPRTYPGRGPWLPWVGQSWMPEQLHGVGPAVKEVADGFALDEYLDAVLTALAAAFPD